MAGESYTSKILRYDEAETHEGESQHSRREELNSSFAGMLTTHQRKYGGGGCTRNTEYPIEGDVDLFLTGYFGDIEESAVYSVDVSLKEGDAATIRTPEREFRVKLFGISIERPEEDRIRKNQTAYISIDVWDEDEELWKEVEAIQSFGERLEWQYPRGDSLQIAVDTAPGRDAEVDFKWLIGEGLSPAEALDYWVVEIMNESQTEWAKEREKTRQAISKNVQSAKSKL
jgi:hypothetical protein